MKGTLKKIILLLVIISCLFSCISGCAVVSRFGKFYKSNLLKCRGVQGLKRPDSDYKTSDSILCSLRGDIEFESYEEYVFYVFEFLTDRYDYVGAAGVYEYNSFFGGAADLDYIACEKKIENYKTETEDYIKYKFIYFREDPQKEYEENLKNPDENGVVKIPETANHVTLTYYKTPIESNIGTEEKPKKITYNFRMQIRKKGLADSYVWRGYNVVSDNLQYDSYIQEQVNVVDCNYLGYVVISDDSLNDYVRGFAHQIGAESGFFEFLKDYAEEGFENNHIAIACVKLKKGKNARIKSYRIEADTAVCVVVEYYEDDSILQECYSFIVLKVPVYEYSYNGPDVFVVK